MPANCNYFQTITQGIQGPVRNQGHQARPYHGKREVIPHHLSFRKGHIHNKCGNKEHFHEYV